MRARSEVLVDLSALDHNLSVIRGMLARGARLGAVVKADAYGLGAARIARRMALISTPKDFIEQHVEANPFEDHKSLWTLPQLQALGYVNTVANAESWIVTT